MMNQNIVSVLIVLVYYSMTKLGMVEIVLNVAVLWIWILYMVQRLGFVQTVIMSLKAMKTMLNML